jgi:hypothetical protein
MATDPPVTVETDPPVTMATDPPIGSEPKFNVSRKIYSWYRFLFFHRDQ